MINVIVAADVSDPRLREGPVLFVFFLVLRANLVNLECCAISIEDVRVVEDEPADAEHQHATSGHAGKIVAGKTLTHETQAHTPGCIRSSHPQKVRHNCQKNRG